MKNNGIRLEEISYTGISIDLLRNLWMILLTAAAVWLGATGIGNFTYEPQYTAEATLVVSVKGSSNIYSNLGTASQMANVFGKVFQSDALRKLIEMDMEEKVQGSITCQQIQETNLIVLSATASNPKAAYSFLHSALKHYEEVSEYVFANASFAIVQEPSVPFEPSNASWLIRNREKFMILGALGMAGIIVLFYVLRYTVKTVKAAEDQLDGEVCGTIPYEKKNIGTGQKRSKKALLLNSPIVSMGYAEASRKVESSVEHKMHKRKQKVLLVTSVSENEGKSTIAANMALALAEKHKRVLLVDGDFRKPAQYKIFESKTTGRKSLEEVLRGEVRWEEAVHFNEKTKVWELFQMRSLANPSKIMDSANIERLLNAWKEEMDYIIVDCSPTAVAADAEMWMQVSDMVLIVVRQDWSDVRVINDTVDLVWDSGAELAGFVLNAFRKEWTQARSDYGYYGYRAANAHDRERGL